MCRVTKPHDGAPIRVLLPVAVADASPSTDVASGWEFVHEEGPVEEIRERLCYGYDTTIAVLLLWLSLCAYVKSFMCLLWRKEEGRNL